MSYYPFPEAELEALARENDEAAKRFRENSRFCDLYEKRAAMLRNAITCHDALRERCLTAELDNRQRTANATD